jgi:hypothetical protein|nr:MAG TPA: hypothetical protein [Caudoviricetes sp.]
MTSTAMMNPFDDGRTSAPTMTTTVTQATESSRAVAEVQAALFIARTNPRDQKRAMDRILNACCRPSLAESAIYAYARGGSSITGPSIRLAEAVAQQWGNMQFGIRELSNQGGKSEVQAFAWDVETNTRREITFTVPHIRHTKKGSYKLEDPRDIYELVANQGARRLRACILAVVPGDVVEAAVNQCQITLQSHTDVTAEGIKKLIEAFEPLNVTKAQIEKFCQCRAEAIKPAQIVRLRSIYTSLRDGMSSPSDWFEPDETAQPTAAIEAKAEPSLKDKIKARKAKVEAIEAQPVTEQNVDEVQSEELPL